MSNRVAYVFMVSLAIILALVTLTQGCNVLRENSQEERVLLMKQEHELKTRYGYVLCENVDTGYDTLLPRDRCEVPTRPAPIPTAPEPKNI